MTTTVIVTPPSVTTGVVTVAPNVVPLTSSAVPIPGPKGDKGDPGNVAAYAGLDTYPAATLAATLDALVTRKAERSEIAVPDLALWFANQLL